MYCPAHFAPPSLAALHDLIRMHPFGALCRLGPNGLDADHLPFEFLPDEGEHGVLRAHVARANPLWQTAQPEQPVLVVFQAGDAYVSPSLYPSKTVTHRQVPTWNYQVVHAHGKLQVRDDARFVRALLERLTRTHEAGRETPWHMGQSPRAFIDALVAAVVGLEITVTRLEGKLKLSENREADDRLAAAETLRASGASCIGQAMLDGMAEPAAGDPGQ